ncbi:pre-rRNA processing protein FTSJ3 [Sarcoptes scabiei]|nr:pre-rRNA processing protein FTSJ3 [Sarcoptes scabiei]
MIHLLNILIEQNQFNQCANYWTRQALMFFDVESSHPFFDMFLSQEYDRQNNFDIRLKRYSSLYLQTMLQNINTDRKLTNILINNGLLIVLQELRKKFNRNIDNDRLISNCISALSFYKESHKHLFHAGWIRVLAEWIHCDDWHLKLEAAKTLFNLDVEKSFLNPSVYILSPIFKSNRNKFNCDIVFVHGLKGGVLKTWRQSDKMKTSKIYTECWPESWLGKEFPNCRIWAINYESFISSWNIVCSEDEFSIQDRSKRMVEELQMAGIGSKPIIWIAHSMGGLLVKYMLSYLHSEFNQTHPILNQTKAIVFFSVPHQGSEMAVWSQNIERLISPPSYVLELRKDCPKLSMLNEEFIYLAKQKQIDCLSFGETKKCTLLKSPFEWKALLVPETSANPGYGKFILLPEDHFNICKPQSMESESYKTLRDFVEKITYSLN